MPPHSPRLALASVASLALVACGAKEEPPIEDLPTLDATTIPEGALELKFPEVVVPPGEVQNCYFMEETAEELWVDSLTSFQGRYGHHLVLFSAEEKEPVGTLRDCTGLSDMTTLRPIIASINFGIDRLPQGMAIRIPAGTQLVLQQHYLNTSTRPILTRDVTYLGVRPAAEVETPVGFLGLSNVNFRLTPSQDEVEIGFACAAPHDLKVLLLGPHMHEYGVRTRTQLGPPDALVTAIELDRWDAHWRDEPAAVARQFTPETAPELKAGDVIRTTCTYRNTSGRNLTFPAEMCATYGYFFPAPRGSETWLCAGSLE
jgi:hypothetical protein